MWGGGGGGWEEVTDNKLVVSMFAFHLKSQILNPGFQPPLKSEITALCLHYGKLLSDSTLPIVLSSTCPGGIVKGY